MSKFLGTGIGYLGKTQVVTGAGKCTRCGARAQLISYSASKYLQLLNFAIFPLGQVRVEGECRLCGQRRVLSLTEWESRREKELDRLGGALEEPAGALAFLEAAKAFSAEDDLAAEAEDLAARFSQDARVLARMADCYSSFREFEQAEEFFRAAQTLEDSLDLQCLWALHLLRQRYPAEAQAKLEPAFELEAYRSSLYLLVEGYQNRGQMEAAARVLARIAATWPSQAVEPEHKWYVARNRGRKELPSVALGIPQPAIPVMVQMLRGSFVPLLVAYAGVTLWEGQNRQIFLLNGTDSPYDIEIRGVRRTLVPNRPETLTIPEGRLDYKVLNSPVPSGFVTIETSWPVRAFQSRTFLVNPDQLGVLHSERNRYTKAPDESDFDRQSQVYSGQQLYDLPDMELEFEPFPKEITVSEGHFDFLFNPSTYIRRLDVFSEPTFERVDLLPDRAAQRKYITQSLDLQPTYEMIMCALRILSEEQLLDSAASRLDKAPTQTAWHILYQNLGWNKYNLEAQYRQRLQASPRDPELQFLLNRVIMVPSPGVTSPFAVLNTALARLSSGDFAGAEKLCRPESPLFRETLVTALEAQGRYAELLAGSLDEVTRTQFLATTGKVQEAENLVNSHLPPLSDFMRLHLNYALGKKSATKSDNEVVQLVAELFDEELEKVLPKSSQMSSWTNHLSLFLLASEQKRKESARTELEIAIDRLAAYPPFSPEYQAAQLLRHPTKPDLALKLNLWPHEKRIILAALILRDPGHRKAYLPLARKLNFERSFPYWTVAKIFR